MSHEKITDLIASLAGQYLLELHRATTPANCGTSHSAGHVLLEPRFGAALMLVELRCGTALVLLEPCRSPLAPAMCSSSPALALATRRSREAQKQAAPTTYDNILHATL